MSQTKKTIRQLYDLFEQMYKIDQISKSVGLQALYGYLSNQMKHNDGNYIHEPSEYIQRMLEAHLDYRMPTGKQFKAGVKMTKDKWIERCRACFYAITCEYLEYGMHQQIESCKSFKPK